MSRVRRGRDSLTASIEPYTRDVIRCFDRSTHLPELPNGLGQPATASIAAAIPSSLICRVMTALATGAGMGHLVERVEALCRWWLSRPALIGVAEGGDRAGRDALLDQPRVGRPQLGVSKERSQSVDRHAAVRDSHDHAIRRPRGQVIQHGDEPLGSMLGGVRTRG